MCANPENMTLYNQFRECPKEAQKPIAAGRLKGKTDINPMWRLKKLTEAFGPCGIGWVISIHRMWIERGAEKQMRNDKGDSIAFNTECTANVEIGLKYKYNGEWSEEVPGIGGAMFVELENRGFNTEDEAYKKAYTDAISVACKALGIAADIYFANDPDSKYETQYTTPPQCKAPEKAAEPQLPFPEVAPAPAKPSTVPLPGLTPAPQISREEAAKVTVMGVTLTELYKTNRTGFMAVLNECPDPHTKEAARVIYEWVKEFSKK
jgi:hypothetical protein